MRKLLKQDSASAMIYGKRKVGKTTLILQALKESETPTVYFECLKSSMEDNIEAFVAVLVRAKVIPVALAFKSFTDVFAYLNTLPQTINIVIDEYPYLKMHTKPETIDSIFQAVIDTHLKNIRLFISGSHVGMMKDMLEERNALYGRFDLTIRLAELNYKECAAFYAERTPYDKVGFYAVFGGSPYINGFIDSKKTLKENITGTILNDTHPIYHYAEQLLISDFTNAMGAERIFYAISNGKKKYGEIEEKLGMKNNGLLSKQLGSLLRMELLAKSYPINKPDDKKKTTYELNDNLLRFYYAFVYKNKSALYMLGAEAFYEEYIAPAITTFISHRFEELCRSYFSLQVQTGAMKGISNIGTYYYDDSQTRTSGEFDVVLQRKDRYDVYEAKYYTTPMTTGEVEKEAEKIRTIKGLQVNRIGFISVSGFENKKDSYDYMDGVDLYR